MPPPLPGCVDMAGRRFLYLAALVGCGVFYIAYGEWLAWVVLLAMLGLPWLSLLISLPALWDFRMDASGPSALTAGQEGRLWLSGSCRFPMPPFRGTLTLTCCQTGASRRHRSGDPLPTAHCGGYTVSVERGRVCDYLGLFSFPARKIPARTFLIRPAPLRLGALPDLQRYLAQRWKPKFGGGYAENHELRLYRPGDSLNQVHWKLTAKTGKLILREPMEPERGRILLTLNLRGTPEELDRKLGRLLSLGRHLLEQNLPFELRALTGEGIRAFPVGEERQLANALDALLSSPAAQGDIREQSCLASWKYHIGGEPDEA